MSEPARSRDAENSSAAYGARTPPTATTTRRAAAWIGSAAWGGNVLLLVVLGAWVVRDPRIGTQLGAQWRLAWPATERGIAARAPAVAEANRRAVVLHVIRAGALVSFVGMLVTLIVGAPRHRRLASWLALLAVAAGWLTLWTAHSTFAWSGQRWRAARQIAAFETIAAPLRRQWPQEDGATEALGAFSAYPFGSPQVLLMLTSPPAAPEGLAFSAIERSPKGALRFELTGPEAGAWLEWHPNGSAPASFAGALMVQGQYVLERTAALGGGWHVSRYRNGGNIVAR